jgi:hypothetical protein
MDDGERLCQRCLTGMTTPKTGPGTTLVHEAAQPEPATESED